MDVKFEDDAWSAFVCGMFLGALLGAVTIGSMVGFHAYSSGAKDYFKGELECSQVYTEVVCKDSKDRIW